MGEKCNIFEQIESIFATIDKINGHIDKMQEDIRSLSRSVSKVDNSVGRLSKSVVTQNGRVGSLPRSINRIEEDMFEFQNSIDDLRYGYIDHTIPYMSKKYQFEFADHSPCSGIVIMK